jgi:ABC-2 type transport system permease protein
LRTALPPPLLGAARAPGALPSVPGTVPRSPDAAPSAPSPHGWLGFRTLLRKEVMRFWKVAFQTIAAPVLTALMYLLVFGHALASHVEAFPGVSYAAFLIPGLVMMSVLQNAFANSSSSLVQSKMMGNLVFLLLPPLSHAELFCAYVGSSMLRGLVVGLGVYGSAVWLAPPPLAAPLWILVFALAGSALLGTLGLIAGIVCDKFDQLAAFQNFVIMPATFLSGVFYSMNGLPPFWLAVSRLNPFFYAIDGFRYGFFARSDVAPGLSLLVLGVILALAAATALLLLRSGYKLRS